LLARKNLGGYFNVVVGADTCGVRKPAPEPLLAAISQLRGNAVDALFTGDSHIDVACAFAAGVDCALFEGGYGDHDVQVSARFATWMEIASGD
jgi:phosphoglycolate phosphatase